MAGIIEKGSAAHNAHLEELKVAAKSGDKSATANLKQHEVKISTPIKDEEKKDETKK